MGRPGLTRLDDLRNMGYDGHMVDDPAHEHPLGADWTTRELADAAHVTTAYLRELLNARKLRGRKVARDWLIGDGDARRWLAERHSK